MKQEIAIVASGGGMGCSYAAGVMNAIYNHYKFTAPDIAIAGSGSTGTFAYYISGQGKYADHVWSRVLVSKKFVDLKRFWKIMNVDYLIDDVFKKQYPLDTHAILDSLTKLFIATTNCTTGKLTYFSNDDRFTENDIFELLRASKSIPILNGKKIPLNEGKYCDTYLSSSIQPHIKKAVELGANKIIAIDNDIRRRFNERIFKIWLASRSRAFKKLYKEQHDEVARYNLPKEVEIIFVRPSSYIKVGTTNNTSELLEESIQMGKDDAVNNKQLSDLLLRVNN